MPSARKRKAASPPSPSAGPGPLTTRPRLGPIAPPPRPAYAPNDEPFNPRNTGQPHLALTLLAHDSPRDSLIRTAVQDLVNNHISSRDLTAQNVLARLARADTDDSQRDEIEALVNQELTHKLLWVLAERLNRAPDLADALGSLAAAAQSLYGYDVQGGCTVEDNNGVRWVAGQASHEESAESADESSSESSTESSAERSSESPTGTGPVAGGTLEPRPSTGSVEVKEEDTSTPGSLASSVSRACEHSSSASAGPSVPWAPVVDAAQLRAARSPAVMLLCGRENWTKETSDVCSAQAVRSLVDRARRNPQFGESVLRGKQLTETNMHRSIFKRAVPANRLSAERVLQNVVSRNVQAFPELKGQYFVFKNICDHRNPAMGHLVPPRLRAFWGELDMDKQSAIADAIVEQLRELENIKPLEKPRGRGYGMVESDSELRSALFSFMKTKDGRAEVLKQALNRMEGHVAPLVFANQERFPELKKTEAVKDWEKKTGLRWKGGRGRRRR
ncbi:uncharacterized protein K452DRAFT_318830 [Aplosporella prunicola CBS 121167]|uniref:Uncharacterized protein n=1 Tax=Aplosporella prunicola CBS 121167 TaxID=1176127 RepID=A0A6A6BCV9_9PEZI|nr:uncharacterized protein K452DRAFT_318830 [Aplosporella prunicola CBS 121167]KAF2141906.1 hypothetical protein K452DRAFT_318830 [Aplosporella prunicola CBS 121167]